MATVERELGARPDVRLVPRHPVHWGSFSPVRAALEGVDALLAAPERLDYGVLLTGQDYPLRPAATIESTLESADGRSFIAYRPPSGRFLRRLTRWHWHGNILGRRVRLPNRFIRLTVRRKLPAGLVPYTGTAHWCLSRECLEYVATRDPELVRFFLRSAVPDESFFQTLLMNSPLADTLVNDDLRYADWSEGGASPRVLTLVRSRADDQVLRAVRPEVRPARGPRGDRRAGRAHRPCRGRADRSGLTSWGDGSRHSRAPKDDSLDGEPAPGHRGPARDRGDVDPRRTRLELVHAGRRGALARALGGERDLDPVGRPDALLHAVRVLALSPVRRRHRARHARASRSPPTSRTAFCGSRRRTG